MGQVISFFASWIAKNKAIGSIEGLSEDGKKTLERLDAYTAVITSVIPGVVISREPVSDEAIKTEDINLGWEKTGKDFADWKKGHPQLDINKYTENFTVEILREDDITGEANVKMNNILRNGIVLPLDDKNRILEGRRGSQGLS